MNDGAGLRLTTARYYTPSGTSIQATGITPDILVETHFAKKEDSDADEKEKKVHFLREKDLKHHIHNGDEKKVKSSETDKKEADGKEKNENDEKAQIKEQIERDNQLKQALILLKGLNVYRKLEMN